MTQLLREGDQSAAYEGLSKSQKRFWRERKAQFSYENDEIFYTATEKPLKGKASPERVGRKLRIVEGKQKTIETLNLIYQDQPGGRLQFE